MTIYDPYQNGNDDRSLFPEKRRRVLCIRLFTLCTLDKPHKTDVCVCVPPWTKGFPPPFLHKQGATAPFISLWPTKLLMIGEDMNLGRQVHVPAFNTLTPMVHPAAVRWFHGFSS